jgi:beta-glucosidase/6-phospho-beta-glucosidase/beta-galactosidase
LLLLLLLPRFTTHCLLLPLLLLLLLLGAHRYNPARIFITENGVSGPGEDSMTTAAATADSFRVNFYR